MKERKGDAKGGGGGKCMPNNFLIVVKLQLYILKLIY